MHSPDDIQYALETTQTLHEPDRRIDTFGSTNLEFLLISELMDSVNQVRIRTGRIHAQQPQILRPESLAEFEYDGFSDEQSRAFSQWLGQFAGKAAFLKYGFQFRKSEVKEFLVNESMEIVRDRVVQEARDSGNPMAAVIQGVDDAWEICLLKFTLEIVQKSHGINLFDFKRRGML
jgi:hypothetical protein